MSNIRWTQPSLVKTSGPSHDLYNRGLENARFVVTSSVDAWVPTGRTRKSNTWIGNANILSLELERFTFHPGDEVLVTCGNALWVLPKGSDKALQVCTDENVKLSASVKSEPWLFDRKVNFVRAR